MISSTTERLIIRLGLQDELSQDMVDSIIRTIKTLPKFFFSTRVHTLYVRAVEEISEGNEEETLRAKVACNETALSNVYEL